MAELSDRSGSRASAATPAA